MFRLTTTDVQYIKPFNSNILTSNAGKSLGNRIIYIFIWYLTILSLICSYILRSSHSTVIHSQNKYTYFQDS